MTISTLRKENIFAYLLFALATVFLFRDLAFNAGEAVYHLTGDSGKNLYTYLYHILYGQGLHFTGMNYPYGEHILFTDNQPILALPLSYLNRWLHFTPAFLMGFMYWLIIGSWWLAMVYIYRILRFFEVRYWLALICTVLTIYLSPQLYRITGHFALAYACFVPMLFYWNLAWLKKGGVGYLLKIYLLCTCFALLHMYFLAMALIWMAGFAAAYTLLGDGKIGQRLKRSVVYCAAIVASVLTVMAFIKLTDDIKDRPVLPYTSEYESPVHRVFTSIASPLWQGLEEMKLIGGHHIKKDVNDPAYISIASDLMMVAGLGILLLTLLKKKRPSFRMHPLWMVLAVVTLLYAMYIPYYWNLPMLKKVLQPLRQFRSPDRLSWIFYFIISVYTALMLDYLLTLFAARRKQMLGYVVVVPVLLIWFIDANGNIIYIHRASENLKANSDQFFMKEGSFKDFLEAKDWNPGSFQAILPLPYVSVGSEKLWMHENQTYAHDMAYRASLELHLPLMSVMMSRTSWSQTFRQVKIASGIYGSHPVLEEIGNKPLLLMVYPNDPLNPDEEEIVHSAALLGEAGGCRLYSFHPATFAERKQKAWKEALDIAASQRTQDSVIGDTTLLYIDHFDGHQSGFAFKDHNAAPAIKGWDSLAFVKDIPAQAIGQQFELSAWVKLPENNHRNCYFDVVCRDSGGKELYREHAFGKMSADNAPGFWFRLNHFFHIPEGSTRLEVYYFNEPDPNYLAVDQLMLRPAKTLIISKRNGAVFANNHLLQR